MAAERQYTANTGLATISAANTNLDGSGTVVSVITGASNGTLVKTVTIKAGASTSALGMVRLFVYDGGNYRLIGEVEIPVTTASSSDQSFEYHMELDLDLKAGYILKASTQNANTFYITAEGLDWTYYGDDIRPDSVNYTANTGVGIISSANSNLDGTGTVVTILTAGSSATYKGCMIKSIIIKAISSTTVDGMVRLFVQDTGSTTKLLTEVPVPIVTYSATARSFVHQINFPEGFNLQAGYKIIAATEKANSFIVTVEGLDWKYPLIGAKGMIAKNFTPVSGTTTTSEEILHSHQIAANIVASGDILEVYASILSLSAGSKTYRIYTNTSNSLSGAILLASDTSTTGASQLSRFLPVVSDTAIESYGNTAVVGTQYANLTTASANVTVASVSAGFWIIISGQKVTGADTDTIRWSMVKNNRV